MSKSITITLPSFRRPSLEALRSKATALADRTIDALHAAAVRTEHALADRKAQRTAAPPSPPTEY